MKTTFRSVHIADIHLGIRNAKDYEKELTIFTDYLSKNIKDIDFVTIDGDLFHKKLSLNDPNSNLAYKFIHKIVSILNGKPLRIILGTLTHDFNQLRNFIPLEKHNCRIIEVFDGEELFEGYYVLYVPEQQMENWKTFYEEFNYNNDEEFGKYHMLIFHGTMDFTAHESQIDEAEKIMKGSPIFDSEIINNTAHISIGGHIHGRTSRKNVHYCGSFSRFGFGDEKSKGFYNIVQNIDGSYEKTFIENTLAPEYNTITVGSELSLEEKTEMIKKYADVSNIRIKFDKDIDDSELEILKENFSSDSNISIKQEKKVTVDIIKDEIDIMLEDDSLTIDDKIIYYVNVKNEQKFDKDKFREVLNF